MSNDFSALAIFYGLNLNPCFFSCILISIGVGASFSNNTDFGFSFFSDLLSVRGLCTTSRSEDFDGLRVSCLLVAFFLSKVTFLRTGASS